MNLVGISSVAARHGQHTLRKNPVDPENFAQEMTAAAGISAASTTENTSEKQPASSTRPSDYSNMQPT